MDTQNNIDQTIEQAGSEFMERIEKTGGAALVIVFHPDLEGVRSSLYGSRLHLVEVVLSMAKAVDEGFSVVCR